MVVGWLVVVAEVVVVVVVVVAVVVVVIEVVVTDLCSLMGWNGMGWDGILGWVCVFVCVVDVLLLLLIPFFPPPKIRITGHGPRQRKAGSQPPSPPQQPLISTMLLTYSDLSSISRGGVASSTFSKTLPSKRPGAVRRWDLHIAGNSLVCCTRLQPSPGDAPFIGATSESRRPQPLKAPR